MAAGDRARRRGPDSSRSRQSGRSGWVPTGSTQLRREMSRIYKQFSTTALILSIIAIVMAATGATYAATHSGNTQKKKVAVKKGPPGPRGPKGPKGDQGAPG